MPLAFCCTVYIPGSSVSANDMLPDVVEVAARWVTFPGGEVMAISSASGWGEMLMGSPGLILCWPAIDTGGRSHSTRLEVRMGKATCKGRSDWCRSNAITATRLPPVSPTMRSGSPVVARTSIRAQGGGEMRLAAPICVLDKSTKRIRGSLTSMAPIAGYWIVPETGRKGELGGAKMRRLPGGSWAGR